MPPILIWNKCIRVTSQGIGYPDYPVINSNIKCPFNCTFTTNRKLYRDKRINNNLLASYILCNKFMASKS
ncbi:unnamed protein product [Meloidogyne enterolobii]|uniref:Uncharacterized protein n=1 Tax=Meloidogyne enterolobii TaxID=390850 RepID=A0ACB1B0H3_MELEN